LVGGVNSPVRAFRHVGGEPLMLVEGNGAMVRDVQGRRFIDCVMGWGALILGHGHPSVLRAIKSQLAQGSMLGLTHPLEVQLAQAITEAFPSIEQVRFAASGTEACMTAIRLARAVTGRSRILMFEGCYHGHSDGLLVKRGLGEAARRAGVPASIAQETLVIPYNDLQALEETTAQHGDTIACAIVEPAAANMGVIVPEGQFVRRLRAVTSHHQIVLIFDEVVTGFRVAYGGAQTLWGITPDLTVLGKIAGGGFPVGALGGPSHLMQRLAPEGPVYHAGTFAGHPITMAAGLATLNELKRSAPYAQLESLGEQLAVALLEAASRSHTSVQVNRFGSMLTVFFSEAPVRNLAEAKASAVRRFAEMANALREQGILLPPSPFEAWFLSTAHTPAMVERIGRAFAEALR